MSEQEPPPVSGDEAAAHVAALRAHLVDLLALVDTVHRPAPTGWVTDRGHRWR